MIMSYRSDYEFDVQVGDVLASETGTPARVADLRPDGDGWVLSLDWLDWPDWPEDWPDWPEDWPD